MGGLRKGGFWAFRNHLRSGHDTQIQTARITAEGDTNEDNRDHNGRQAIAGRSADAGGNDRKVAVRQIFSGTPLFTLQLA